MDTFRKYLLGDKIIVCRNADRFIFRVQSEQSVVTVFELRLACKK